MNKKQGNRLPPGIYKVFWKSGGWSWGALGEVTNHVPEPETRLHEWLEKGCPPNFDRQIMCCNWSGSIPGSRMWRKIARVERARLKKMEGER